MSYYAFTEAKLHNVCGNELNLELSFFHNDVTTKILVMAKLTLLNPRLCKNPLAMANCDGIKDCYRWCDRNIIIIVSTTV